VRQPARSHGIPGPAAAALLALAVSLGPPAPPARAASPSPIRIRVDATEAPRGILHARLEIPVRPGPVTLVYPKWIPGEHGPTGPLVGLAGIKITAAGRTVAWERDLVDMHAFHCRVPPGASLLDVTLDFLFPRPGGDSWVASSTAQLLTLNWNQVVLYPAGRAVDEIPVVAWLQLPAGWRYGTALQTVKLDSALIQFAPVSLATLVDSPVLAGAHFRRVDVSPAGGPPSAVDLACDSEAGLAAGPELIAGWKQLVAEGGALFGARHYRHYDFLVSLSDHLMHDGLEHHESSDNRMPERALVDDDLRLANSGLLPHEFAHSWNGKYRRPAGLLSPDFQQPMKTDLLWMYEGLTSYLGFVLTARSGLASPERAREDLAYAAGWLDKRAGRTWRPLQDTADEAQVLYGAPRAWESWRRGVDFYEEGVLIWLEADVLIRQRTGGKRSLDDFCRAFFGASGGARTRGERVGGAPAVVPYTLDDLVKALGQVAPHDWRAFFAARLRSTSPRPPLGGLEGSGWRLVWADTLNPTLRAAEKDEEHTDLRYSIGVLLDQDGTIADVVPGSVAADAGLGPGMKPLAVNGMRFSIDRLREALREGKNGTAPLELLAENGESVRAYRLDWHGGELYPALARDPAKPDLLAEILKPLTPRVVGGKEGGE
jgi:predicted metalloprotease with PDZ domain